MQTRNFRKPLIPAQLSGGKSCLTGRRKGCTASKGSYVWLTIERRPRRVQGLLSVLARTRSSSDDASQYTPKALCTGSPESKFTSEAKSSGGILSKMVLLLDRNFVRWKPHTLKQRAKLFNQVDGISF